MAKDPAILFYTSDFLTGTLLMNFEEKGLYIHLLCIQHQLGGIPEKDMINICKSYDAVMIKFEKCDDGKFRNKRMSEEIEKRVNYSKSRSLNKKGKHHMKIISSSYEDHMDNENENENINKIDKGKGGVGENENFLNLKEKFYSQSIIDVGWHESLSKATGIIITALPMWIEKFKDYSIASEENYQMINQWRKHATNWIKGQYLATDKKKYSKTNQNGKSESEPTYLDGLKKWYDDNLNPTDIPKPNNTGDEWR